MARLRPVLLLFGMLMAQPALSATEACLANRTDEPLFLAIDTGTVRVSGWRDPGEQVCAPAGPEMVTASAFLDPEAVEGCSRRVPGTGQSAILAYDSIDLCRWSDAK